MPVTVPFPTDDRRTPARTLSRFLAGHQYDGVSWREGQAGFRLWCSCGHASERLSSLLTADELRTYDDPDWYLDHLDDLLADAGLAFISRPAADTPTPALVQAAYIVQDDLSTPPALWAIAAAADVIGEYIGWRHLLAGQIKTVIFDEVQELRRSDSEKYSAAAAIADGGDRRMGLSATPVYNYGGEVFNIYEILKPGVLGTREEFFREWGSFQRTTGDIVVSDPAALGEFLRDQGLLLRRTRADVGRELPEPTEVVMDIDSATDATDAAMADVVQMAHLVLSGTRQERFTAAGQIDMKLRQATGIDKAPYVAAFARLLLESETKIVIFGWHRAVYDIWLRELSEFQPTMFTGTETAAQKQASVDRFTTDPNCRIFLCSLRSGAGLDGLQGVASVCIFGELDWSPAMHHQAIGRLARDGQEGEVVAYYPVSNIGSDPIISGVLEDKRQQAEPFMAGDDGALFTAQTDDTGRIKRLAQAVLDNAHKKPAQRRRAS